MSLSYDLSNVSEFEVNFPDRTGEDGQPKLNGVVQTVLYYSIFVGLGEITEKNTLEWYFRMRMYDALFGSIATDNKTGQFVSIPLDVIKELVGLRCNVSDESRTVFMRRMTRNFFDRIQTEVWGAEDAAKKQ